MFMAGVVASRKIVAAGWDLANASYDSKSYDVSIECTTPRGFTLKADGTKLYVNDNSDDTLHQYSLSTAWDISSASYDSVSFDFSSDSTVAYDIKLSDDGTKMYLNDTTGDNILEYPLSTAWNISTAGAAVLTSQSESGLMYIITFKPDGTKMYCGDSGGTDTMFQYSLSTAWDTSTATYDSKSYSLNSDAGLDTAPYGHWLKDDGTKLYIAGTTNKKVYQFSLSTAWDISSASYDSVSFDFSSEATYFFGMLMKTDGTKMYGLDIITKKIFQYSL